MNFGNDIDGTKKYTNITENVIVGAPAEQRRFFQVGYRGLWDQKALHP